MFFEWENEAIRIKNEILTKFNNGNKVKIIDFIIYDPYFLVDDNCDIFLFFMKLKYFDVCLYWIKYGYYVNRYFQSGKSTLYYILNYCKNSKIIYELFIYWKFNQDYVDQLYFNEHVENYYDILVYYYLNNNICPTVLFKEPEMIKNSLFIKNKHICSECIDILINNNHKCETKLDIFENKFVIGYICQSINCNSCLNNFIEKNSIGIKKKMFITNKSKSWMNIVFDVNMIKSCNGDYEDSIDMENINHNEKFYKCTSKVPHYFKYENWIQWSNQKNTVFENKCCTCKLDMENTLYINNPENNNDKFYFYGKKSLSNLQLKKLKVKIKENYNIIIVN